MCVYVCVYMYMCVCVCVLLSVYKQFIRFQELLFKISNSIYQVLQLNTNNIHRAVWFR